MSRLIKTFAANVRSHRTALGWSQEHLADVAGLHRAYVGAIERCEKNITFATLEKIAAALDTDPVQLLYPSAR